MDHIRHKKRRSIYLLDKHHQKIKLEAEKQELSFSAYVVETALAGKNHSRDDKRRLIDLYVELGRIGNNLNQIARSFNQKDPDYKKLSNDLPEAISLLKEIRKELQDDH